MDNLLKNSEKTLEPRMITALNNDKTSGEKRLEVQVTYSQTKQLPLQKTTLINHRVVTAIENDEVIAAYKILRTRLLQKLKANRWNCVGITSARRSQGSTLSAINLALCLAQETTHSVLLIDMNLKNPAICSTLGIATNAGLENYLFDDVGLEKILINPGIEKLVILPCREMIESSSELMSSPKISELVDDVKSRYPNRIILFDLPPVLEGDEVISFAPNIDGLLLVIEENVTTKEDIYLMSDLLKGVPILGTVLNKSGA